MQQLAALIQERSWTRAEVAQYSDSDQFHAHDLLRGSVSRFSLDALIDIAAKLGHQVRVRLEARYLSGPQEWTTNYSTNFSVVRAVGGRVGKEWSSQRKYRRA